MRDYALRVRAILATALQGCVGKIGGEKAALAGRWAAAVAAFLRRHGAVVDASARGTRCFVARCQALFQAGCQHHIQNDAVQRRLRHNPCI